MLGAGGNQNKFYAVRQPIVRLKDRKLIGYELLSRLDHTDYVSPKDFFKLAMDARVLAFIDRLCLQTCVKANDDVSSDCRIHVNLFPSTISEIPPKQLLSEFRKWKDKIRFCIEISEQQIIGDPSHLVDAVRTIQQSGILVAVDDIGFGSSCLESLVLLEPDIVKIDKCCVENIHKDQWKVRAMKRLLKIIQSCDAQAHAEGIESEEELNILIDLGVKYGQGFLFSEPVRAIAV